MPSSSGSARAASIHSSPPPAAVLRLLAEAQLPVADLAGQPMDNFFGCGDALVKRAERHAQEQGARRIYPLTTSAADFFAHLGYKRVDRQEVPESIRATSEFSALCPVGSVLMLKEVAMASAKQKAAARRNIRKAAKAARRKRTIAHLPKKTRRALGKQAAKVAKRRKHR